VQGGEGLAEKSERKEETFLARKTGLGRCV